MLENLIYSIISFIVVFLIYYSTVFTRKSKIKKYRKSTEIKLLENKYKVNIDNYDLKKLGITLALYNSLIISITVFIIGFIKNIYLKLIVGFVIIVILILVVYSFIGKSLRKGDKNV